MKIILKTISIVYLILSCSTCTPTLKSRIVIQPEVEFYEASSVQAGNRLSSVYLTQRCGDPMVYIPDTNHLDHSPWKVVRVNFHWMNSADSTHNFYGERAKKFIQGLLHSAEKDMRENKKLWLPYNNDIPVISPRIRYQLTPVPGDPDDDGIYEHFDDALCYYVHRGKNRNLGSRRVLDKYGIQQDSVLNIFIMPHHPDSVASPTYASYGVGVTVRNFIKLAGPFELKNPSWAHRGTFNHEVGHVLGLRHAWINDGCNDTPEHKQNCWHRTKTPPCDKEASNNMMDYNALQQALSPCQIGVMHKTIANEKSIGRRFIVPTWCRLNPKKTIVIQDSIVWEGAKDLEGHLVIEDGGSLTIKCRVSLPKTAKIIVQPGGVVNLVSGRLHNACGEKWYGIELNRLGKRAGNLKMSPDSKIEDAIFLQVDAPDE